jgi:cytoskeletal protein CcmA (bactofilin family)
MAEPAFEEDAPETAPVLVAAGAEFHGLLALAGPARVDGVLRGEVIGPGPLWVGRRALVEARVETDELIIAGAVDGEVRATRRVALAGSARVRGELYAPSLALADGAVLEGRCAAGPRDGEPEAPAPGASSSPASS